MIFLTGCGGAAPTETPSQSPAPTETGIVDGPPWFMTCRVVDGAGTDTLLLAGNGDTADKVYLLPSSHVDGEVADGQLINVYFETIMESYPAQFGGVSKVELPDQPIDDRCGLYLRVLEDLWAVDPGLNSGVTQIGIDLSGVTDLCGSERSAVAYAFSNAHDLFPAVTGTWEELAEEGYIDEEQLYWEDGIFFSVTGSAEDFFNAQKWRSGDGAYFFFNCTAEMAGDGSWTYETGGEAIS